MSTAPTYAILGDIHSNWEALSAVLADAAAQGATHFACIGDIVGYNADPIRCLDRIRELGCVCVRGNHDHYCSHDEHLGGFHPLAAVVIDWTRRQLDEDRQHWLRDLPYLRNVEQWTLVHATLDMPDKWAYMFDELDALTHFCYQITPVCFHGHTHIPIVFQNSARVETLPLAPMTLQRGHKYFINVGSIGQPRDGDPRASYAIYNPVTRALLPRRVPYDIAAAQAKVVEAGLPKWLAERLALGK